MGVKLNKIIFLVGIACAVIAGFLVFQQLEEADARLAPSSYLTFSADARDEVLFAGDEVAASSIGTVQIPNGYDVFGLAENLIENTPVNRAWIEGKTLNASIPRGRVLTYDLFEALEADRLDQVVSNGMRAISLPVDKSSSLSNRVVPGNRIDILGVIDSAGTLAEAEMVLEDVRVIAVGKNFSYDSFRSEGERNYSTITIEVTKEQGIKLATDRERVSGAFIVMLRNQCDTANPNATCG